MFEHLLVPVDGGPLSERAMQASLELARKLGARITGFVTEPLPPLPTMSSHAATYARDAEEHILRTDAHAQAVLQQFANLAAEQAVPFDGRVERSDAIDDAIVAAAQQCGCDMIVMATHGRGAIGEMLFGSHTKSVLGRCKLPVLVLH